MINNDRQPTFQAVRFFVIPSVYAVTTVALAVLFAVHVLTFPVCLIATGGVLVAAVIAFAIASCASRRKVPQSTDSQAQINSLSSPPPPGLQNLSSQPSTSHSRQQNEPQNKQSVESSPSPSEQQLSNSPSIHTDQEDSSEFQDAYEDLSDEEGFYDAPTDHDEVREVKEAKNQKLEDSTDTDLCLSLLFDLSQDCPVQATRPQKPPIQAKQPVNLFEPLNEEQSIRLGKAIISTQIQIVRSLHAACKRLQHPELAPFNINDELFHEHYRKKDAERKTKYAAIGELRNIDNLCNHQKFSEAMQIIDQEERKQVKKLMKEKNWDDAEDQLKRFLENKQAEYLPMSHGRLFETFKGSLRVFEALPLLFKEEILSKKAIEQFNRNIASGVDENNKPVVYQREWNADKDAARLRHSLIVSLSKWDEHRWAIIPTVNFASSLLYFVKPFIKNEATKKTLESNIHFLQSFLQSGLLPTFDSNWIGAKAQSTLLKDHIKQFLPLWCKDMIKVIGELRRESSFDDLIEAVKLSGTEFEKHCKEERKP